MTIKKILIVDDSPTERHVLNDLLTKAGYDVIASDNGEDAIQKAKQMRPDLILMDVVMPGPQRLPGDARDQPRRRHPKRSRSSSARRRARKPTRSGECARARAITS